MNLDQAQKEVAQYADPQNLVNLQAKVAEAWKPLIERGTKETSRMMSEFGDRFAQIPYTGIGSGTGATALTPQQQIQSMYGQLGMMGGQLAENAGLVTNLGGQLRDMTNTALSAWDRGQSAAQQRFQNAFQRYALARSSSGSSRPAVNIPAPNTQTLPPDVHNAVFNSSDPHLLYQVLKQHQFDKPLHDALWDTWRQREYGDWVSGMKQGDIDNMLNNPYVLNQNSPALNYLRSKGRI